jgi:hypothetical protein
LETASISYPNFINDLKNISIRLEVLKWLEIFLEKDLLL